VSDAAVADRIQFAFTVMFHYIFPIITMGLGPLIAYLKTMDLIGKGTRYGQAARFWARYSQSISLWAW
jgi:cytochrome bd ubiquinol oxidase subunit I